MDTHFDLLHSTLDGGVASSRGRGHGKVRRSRGSKSTLSPGHGWYSMRNESIIQNLSSAFMTAFLGCLQEKMECAIQVCLPHVVSQVKRALLSAGYQSFPEDIEMNEMEGDEDEDEDDGDEDEEEEEVEEVETKPPPKQRVSRKVSSPPLSHKMQRSPSNPLPPSAKKQSKSKNTRGKKKQSQSKSSKSSLEEPSSSPLPPSTAPPLPPPPPPPPPTHAVPSTSHHLSPSPPDHPDQNVYHLSAGKPPSAFPIDAMQSQEFTSQFPSSSQQYF